MVTKTASCSCGQLSISVRGDPQEILVCHCLECQKQSGSVFLSWAYWPKTAIAAKTGEVSR